MKKIILIDESDGYQASIMWVLLYDEQYGTEIENLYTKFAEDQKKLHEDKHTNHKALKKSYGYDEDTIHYHSKNGVQQLEKNSELDGLINIMYRENWKEEGNLKKKLLEDLKQFGEIIIPEYTITLGW